MRRVITALPMTGSPSESIARDINDRGQVVGHGTETCCYIGCPWRRGAMTEFETAPGGGLAVSQLNNRGQVLGDAADKLGGAYVACIWRRGQVTRLTPPAGWLSIAWALNQRGQFLGEDQTLELWHRALVAARVCWSTWGRRADSGASLEPSTSAGPAVGHADTAHGQRHAALRSPHRA
jgi:uncharacterized membrane protein